MLGPGSSESEAAARSAASDDASRKADADAVRRIASGDRAALADAATRHFPRVFAVARRMTGNDAEAEDVSQDVFLRLWTSPPDLDASGARLSTWLYRVTVNRCLDLLRRNRPDQLDEDQDIVLDGPDPEDEAGAGQVARTIEAALSRLPERQRAALVLTYYEGMSNKEAAALLDTGVEALESLLSRARRTLRRDLDGQWSDLLSAITAAAPAKH